MRRQRVQRLVGSERLRHSIAVQPAAPHVAVEEEDRRLAAVRLHRDEPVGVLGGLVVQDGVPPVQQDPLFGLTTLFIMAVCLVGGLVSLVLAIVGTAASGAREGLTLACLGGARLTVEHLGRRVVLNVPAVRLLRELVEALGRYDGEPVYLGVS